MKKLIFGLIATIIVTSSSFGQTEKKKIDKTKAGFMAVGDVIAGAAASGLGPYGILWGGFMGSCGAAVLYNDMFSRNSSSQQLIEPKVFNNPNHFFDKYALVGKLHNDLMIKYCNNDYYENVFSKNNRPSDYIKSQILKSEHFSPETNVKEKFIDDLTIFDNLFDNFYSKKTIPEIVTELNRINLTTSEEQNFYSKIINFTLNEENNQEKIFSFVNEMEETINASKLNENSKIKLFYSLEVLRYSYALWYQNIQE
jgi:hypothetical protein